MSTRTLPATAAQDALWLAYELGQPVETFTCAAYLEITGELDAGLLRRAVAVAVADSDALRARFARRDDQLWQLIAPPGPGPAMPLVDLSAEADPESAADAWLTGEAALPMDPGGPEPLL